MGVSSKCELPSSAYNQLAASAPRILPPSLLPSLISPLACSAPPPARMWQPCRRTAAADGPSPTWEMPSASWCRCEPVYVNLRKAMGGWKGAEGKQVTRECYRYKKRRTECAGEGRHARVNTIIP